jgi:hypothetical protein
MPRKTKKTGMAASLEIPKDLEKSLTEKEAAYVRCIVDEALSPEEAYYAAGYNSKGHRAKRLQRHLWKHIEKRIEERVGETATLALSVLENLMRSADSENVKLNAARDILSRAGYDAVARQETTIKEASDLTDEELDAQIALMSNVVKITKK